MKRKLFNTMLCSSLLFGGTWLPIAAQKSMPMTEANVEIVYSGTIGTANWTIDSNGVLTIGEGEFTNYDQDFEWPWKKHLEYVNQINGSANFKINGSLSKAFYGGVNEEVYHENESVTSINLSGWDTSSVTDMSCLFSDCSALTALNLSGWDTSSVTDFSAMFADCNSLKALDLSHFDTSSASNLRNIFENCSLLSNLNISNWDVSSVTDMSNMFRNCISLTALDLADWNVASVTSMFAMFDGCINLTDLDLTKWDVSSVKETWTMFSYCLSLTSLDLSNWDMSAAEDVWGMFRHCGSLKTLDLAAWDTSSVTSMTGMFYCCDDLSSLDITGWDTSALSETDSAFYKCTALSEIKYSESAKNFLYALNDTDGWYQDGIGPYSIEDLPVVPAGQSAILSRISAAGSDPSQKENLPAGKIGTADWSIDSNGVLTIGEGEFINNNDNDHFEWPWHDYANTIRRVDGTADFKVTGYLDNLFSFYLYSDSLIESIDLSGWDVSEVTSMFEMFSGCNSLKSLSIGSWDTSSVITMSRMFKDCSGLESLDLNCFDTSSVRYMESMFQGCTSLSSINIDSWDTSSVQSMKHMFEGCTSLSSINIDSWNTSSVTSMEEMFAKCRSLASLDVSSWHTPNLGTTKRMFAYCSSLTSLNLDSWKPSKIGTIAYMFKGCTSLSSLDIGSWDVTKTSNLIQTGTVTFQELEECVLGGCFSLSKIRYSQNSRKLLDSLPSGFLWYQNNNGPYTIENLPELPNGKTAWLTKEKEAVKIDQASVSGIHSQYSYTGKAIIPKAAVKIGDTPLVEGKDYTVSYSNNVSPGTASMTITGTGDYTGIIRISFTIVKPFEKPSPVQISPASITGISAQYAYTGKAITPKPVVKIGNKTLANGKDYKVSYSNNVNPGTATLTITGIESYTGSVKIKFTIVKTNSDPKPQPKPQPAESSKMHRLYNPNSGEHFYTSNTVEKDMLVSVGWKYEGEGWKAPDKSKTPVYRLYNANAGDHHYTMNTKEKDMLVSVGWKYEGIGWYSDDNKTVPLYRQYNPNAKAGSHNYTTSKGENDGLVRLGWKAEGIGWYGMK